MPTTLAEATKKIGKMGFVNLGPKGEVAVEVEILDFKNSYGKDRWLVTPRTGAGQMWVETVTLLEV